MSMAQPYIGLFADGAEQWSQKVGLLIKQFSKEEKEYYTLLRNKHKLFDYSYDEFYNIIHKEFIAHDLYFDKNKAWIEKYLLVYKNFGVDYCNTKVCGNTIIIGVYSPYSPVEVGFSGKKIRELSVVAGKLCIFFEGDDVELYFNNKLHFNYKDYHLFKEKLLLKNANFDTFCLFSILCSINYIIYFIDRYFLKESPTKLRFAYLQYYYIVKIIDEINSKLNTNFTLDKKWINKEFRNSMAHYGLGQILNEMNINKDDILGGITNIIFDLDYIDFKNVIYDQLDSLSNQIEKYVLR